MSGPGESDGAPEADLLDGEAGTKSVVACSARWDSVGTSFFPGHLEMEGSGCSVISFLLVPRGLAGDSFVVAVPHSAWNRAAARRLPRHGLSRALNLEVVVAG